MSSEGEGWSAFTLPSCPWPASGVPEHTAVFIAATQAKELKWVEEVTFPMWARSKQ